MRNFNLMILVLVSLALLTASPLVLEFNASKTASPSLKPMYEYVPGRLLIHMHGLMPTKQEMYFGELGFEPIDEVTEHMYGVNYVYDPEEFDDIYELVFDDENVDLQQVISILECSMRYHSVSPNDQFYAIPDIVIRLDDKPDAGAGSDVYTDIRNAAISMMELIPPMHKRIPVFRPETDLSKLVKQYLDEQSVSAPNDPMYGDQHHFQLLQADKAWGKYPQTDVKVPLYIIDQGMDYNHEDLNANMFMWQDSYGYDFVNDRNDPKNRADYEMHGTHVGGIAAAVMGNGKGGSGFSNNIQLRSFRVLSEQGSGTLFTIARGIKAAADEAVKLNSLRPENLRTKIPGVINMSLGATNRAPRFMMKPMEEACDYAYKKGMFIVAAAGNEGNDQGTTGNGAGYPAVYNTVIGVGASAWYNKKEGRAFFSNFGKGVDLCAPGAGITRATRGDGILSTVPNDKYAKYCGTSMASPVAAGLACYLITQCKDITQEQLKRILIDTGDEIKLDKPMGKRVNMFKAVEAVKKLQGMPDLSWYWGFTAPDYGQWSVGTYADDGPSTGSQPATRYLNDYYISIGDVNVYVPVYR